MRSQFCMLALAAGLTCPPALSSDMTALGRAILKEQIEINTTHAKGTTLAAQAVQARLLAAGFDASDVHLVAPAAHPQMGNVVVRLRGQGKDKPVLFLGHLDVVEAKREDWSFDPFLLTEKDGWLYGRGVIDMKGQDAAMLAALITLKQTGFVPERDIILALTADEEAGTVANGVEFLLKEHRALVDAGLAINPDGGEAGMKHGRRLYVGVQTSEKQYMSFAAEVLDKGGHSSRPTGQNPIYRLARALGRLDAFQFPLHLTSTTRQYFERRATLESGATRAAMQSLVSAKPAASALKRLSDDVETNIIMRTTCTTTMVEGGHAENALPQRARATIQCRAIPGETADTVRATLDKVLADPGIRVTQLPGGMPSPETALAPGQLAQVEKLVHQHWPGVQVLPQMSAGASDSIYTRKAGIPTLGIDGMFDDLDDARAHGRDERISIQVFGDEIEFMATLMRAFGGH